MTIYDEAGAALIEIIPNDNSQRIRSVMGEDSITLIFEHNAYLAVPIGSYVYFEGLRYTLEREANFKKHGTRKFEYTLIMEGTTSRLDKYKLRDGEGRLKFSYTATPQEHLQLIINTLNAREGGWEITACIESSEKVISYNHNNCREALQMIAEQFNTEWEVVGKTLRLIKVEYNKETPLPLSYGRGNGFVPGVGRFNFDSKRPTDKLFVQGGEKNINPSTYGSRELLLPKNKSLVYEGVTYISDNQGLSIQRLGTIPGKGQEDSLDCSHISPGRVGAVSSIEIVDEEKHFYDIIDLSIPEELDFSQYRITGENITLIFQTGMLVGKEFDIEQSDKGVTGYIHQERRWRLAPIMQDGMALPGGAYLPAIGDKYAIFGIELPEAYVCNDTTREGASWEMFRESAKHLHENEEQRFSFVGELDAVWARQNWDTIWTKIRIGGYISFTDAQFQTTPVNIRIISIRDALNKPHNPEIELNNSVGGTGIGTELDQIGGEEVVVDEKFKQSMRFTQRRMRDSQETLKMLETAIEGFGEGINPITIQTMALLVGSESLQFRFVSSKTTPTAIQMTWDYNPETKIFTSPAAILQHMTLGIKTISPSHAPSEYRYWTIAAYNSGTIASAGPLYVYAKCIKNLDYPEGQILLTETSRKMDPNDGFLYFLCGTLSSLQEGTRSFVTLHGFTEILPGGITTSKLVSPDGNTYLDLENGIIGGKISMRAGSSGLGNLNEWPAVSTTIANAYNLADQANQSVGSLNNYIEGAFSDGIIEEAEAKAIEKYINTINETKAKADVEYQKIYENVGLTGATKTALATKKGALDASVLNLITSINTAISDSKTTPAEKANVDAKYALYATATAEFTGALQDAIKMIQDSLKGNTEEYEYLKNAIQNQSTEVQGGLLMTSVLFLRGLDNLIRAGISGLKEDGIFLFADETGGYQKAIQGRSMFLLRQDGTANLSLLRINKHSIGIFEKLYSGTEFIGYGREVVRFQDTPIPSFSSLITIIDITQTYAGGTQSLNTTGAGHFGYSPALVVSGADSFNITIQGRIDVYGYNYYEMGDLGLICQANVELNLYLLSGGQYYKERTLASVSSFDPGQGDTYVEEIINTTFGLPAGTYVLRAEYQIQANSQEYAIANCGSVTLQARGGAANQCMVFGSNGFARIKDGTNYTYITDEVTAMAGLPSTAGLLNSGTIYKDPNNFLKTS